MEAKKQSANEKANFSLNMESGTSLLLKLNFEPMKSRERAIFRISYSKKGNGSESQLEAGNWKKVAEAERKAEGYHSLAQRGGRKNALWRSCFVSI